MAKWTEALSGLNYSDTYEPGHVDPNTGQLWDLSPQGWDKTVRPPTSSGGILDVPGEIAHGSLPGLAVPAVAAGVDAGVAAFGGDLAGAAGGGAGGGGALMPPAVPETAESLGNMGLTQVAPGEWSAAGVSSAGAAAPAAGDPTAPPDPTVDPTAPPPDPVPVAPGAPGLSAPLDAAATGAESFSGSAGGSGLAAPTESGGMVPGTDNSIFTGGTPTDTPNPLPDQTITPEGGGGIEEVLAKAGVPKETMDKVLNGLAKYGPLGLGAASILGNRGAAKKAAGQIREVGGPQRAIANDMITQAQAGNINQADQYQIDQWKQGAIAQSRAYYAKAGISDSSMAQNAEAEINAKATAMHEQARQQLLQTGLETLNITDKTQVAAIQAELAGDQQTQQQITQFMNAYGSWLRALPTFSKQQPPATP